MLYAYVVVFRFMKTVRSMVISLTTAPDQVTDRDVVIELEKRFGVKQSYFSDITYEVSQR